jgi:hypothetical protein
VALVVGGVRRSHVLERHHDLDIELLVPGGIDNPYRTRLPAAGAEDPAAEEGGDAIERPLGGAQSDALRWHRGDLLEALQGEGEVRSALGGCDRMDLVDDHPPHRLQQPGGRGREHEVEALRCGDQDVRGMLQHPPAFLGRGVAGAQRRNRGRQRFAATGGGMGDAPQWAAQVALDVVSQCLEWGHVEHPASVRFGWRVLVEQPVQRPEEGGQGLARTGRGVDQGVLARGDRLPTQLLSRGGGAKRGFEPLPGRRGEAVEGGTGK